MIFSADWVEVPHNGRIVKAEVVDTLRFRRKGYANYEEIATLREVDTGEVFSSSVESCVEIDD
jgi:hypothetical protein